MEVPKRRPGPGARGHEKEHQKMVDTYGDGAQKPDPFRGAPKSVRKPETAKHEKLTENSITAKIPQKSWGPPHHFRRILELQKWTCFLHQSPRHGPHLGVRKRRPRPRTRRHQKWHPKMVDTNGDGASKPDPLRETQKIDRKFDHRQNSTIIMGSPPSFSPDEAAQSEAARGSPVRANPVRASPARASPASPSLML